MVQKIIPLRVLKKVFFAIIQELWIINSYQHNILYFLFKLHGYTRFIKISLVTSWKMVLKCSCDILILDNFLLIVTMLKNFNMMLNEKKRYNIVPLLKSIILKKTQWSISHSNLNQIFNTIKLGCDNFQVVKKQYFFF